VPTESFVYIWHHTVLLNLIL